MLLDYLWTQQWGGQCWLNNEWSLFAFFSISLPSWLCFDSQDPLVMSSGSDGCNTFHVLVTIRIAQNKEIVFDVTTVIIGAVNHARTCSFPFLLHAVCGFSRILYAHISSFFAHVLLNLSAMYVYLQFCIDAAQKGSRRWKRERVLKGMAIQSGIFTADRGLLPQNWSYYLSAQIKIVKLIQSGCCAQRDGPPLQSTALWHVMILVVALSIC